MPFNKIKEVIENASKDSDGNLIYNRDKIKEAGAAADKEIQEQLAAWVDLDEALKSFQGELALMGNDVEQAMIKANMVSFDKWKDSKTYDRLKNRVFSEKGRKILETYGTPKVKPWADIFWTLDAENTDPMRTVIKAISIIGNVGNDAMKGLMYEGVERESLVHLQNLCAECIGDDAGDEKFNKKHIAAITTIQMLFTKYEKGSGRSRGAGKSFGIDGVAGSYTMKTLTWIVDKMTKSIEYNESDEIFKENLHRATIIDVNGKTTWEVSDFRIAIKSRKGKDEVKYMDPYSTVKTDAVWANLPNAKLNQVIKGIGGNPDSKYILKRNEDTGKFECHEIPVGVEQSAYEWSTDFLSPGGEKISHGYSSDGKPEIYVYTGESTDKKKVTTVPNTIKEGDPDNRWMELPNGKIIFFNTFVNGVDSSGKETVGRYEIHEKLDMPYTIDTKNIYDGVTFQGDLTPTEKELLVQWTTDIINVTGDDWQPLDLTINVASFKYSYESHLRTGPGEENLEFKWFENVNGGKEMAPGESVTFISKGLKYELTATTDPKNPEIKLIQPKGYDINIDRKIAKYFNPNNPFLNDDFITPDGNIDLIDSSVDFTIDGEPAHQFTLEKDGEQITGEKKVEIVVDNLYKFTGTIKIVESGGKMKVTVDVDGPLDVPPQKPNLTEDPVDIDVWYFESTEPKKSKKKITGKIPEYLNEAMKDKDKPPYYVNQLKFDSEGKVVNMTSIDKLQNQNESANLDNLIDLVPNIDDKVALSRVKDAIWWSGNIDFIQVSNGRVIWLALKDFGKGKDAISCITGLSELRTLGIKNTWWNPISMDLFPKLETIIPYADSSFGNKTLSAKVSRLELNKARRRNWNLEYTDGAVTGTRKSAADRKKWNAQITGL